MQQNIHVVEDNNETQEQPNIDDNERGMELNIEDIGNTVGADVEDNYHSSDGDGENFGGADVRPDEDSNESSHNERDNANEVSNVGQQDVGVYEEEHEGDRPVHQEGDSQSRDPLPSTLRVKKGTLVQKGSRFSLRLAELAARAASSHPGNEKDRVGDQQKGSSRASVVQKGSLPSLRPVEKGTQAPHLPSSLGTSQPVNDEYDADAPTGQQSSQRSPTDSRMSHMFDIIREQNNELLVIEIIGLADVDKTTVLKMLKIDTIARNRYTEDVATSKFAVWDTETDKKIMLSWLPVSRPHCLIFVLDSSPNSQVERAKDELHQILKEDGSTGCVLLIFAHKAADNSIAISKSDIEAKLELNSIAVGCKWCVQPICASGDGIFDGLDWVAKNVKFSGSQN